MSQPVTMPALSDTMGAGRLVKWTKQPGDKIKKGDVIAEVETDKAVMEVEAFKDGFLSGPLATEGTDAPVGEIIGYIVDNSNEISKAAAAHVPPASSGDGKVSDAPASATPAISAVLAASTVTPRTAPVRRTPPSPARTETAGRTRAADPSQSVLAAGPPYRLERASSLREAVARNMIANAGTPTFRVTAQLPLDSLLKTAQERQQSVSLLLARACALTIVAHPLFNAAYTPEGLARRDRVDIAIAIDRGDGLITPVLRDAAGRSMAALTDDWANLREKVKARRLLPADYSGATFYLSNLGSSSIVYAFDSIIPVGASAILSVAASRREGAFCTLACDHRVVFGADAARFLETLGHQINDPAKLIA
jgi:pyruvate dehydrogenase E2 component (dihydrolipoamide acetyltransferase)